MILIGKISRISAYISLLILIFGALEGAVLAEEQQNPNSDPVTQQQVEVNLNQDKVPSNSAPGAENKIQSSDNQAASQDQSSEQQSPEDFMLELLQNKLSVNTSLYRNLVEQEGETKEELVEIEEKIGTLQGQLEYVDKQILLTEKKIKNVQKRIGFTEVEIENLLREIEEKNILYEEQKTELQHYLRLIYYHNQTYGDVDDGSVSAVKLLFSDDSISSVLLNKTYLSMLKQTTTDIMDRVVKLKQSLEEKNKRLDEERLRLSLLNQELLQQQAMLEAQKEGKQKLLLETQNKEDIFQNLLIQTKMQEDEVLGEIEHLRTNISYFENAARKLEQRLSPQQYVKVLRIKDAILNGTALQGTRFPILPVPVEKGFSAFFSDSHYKRTFGFEHQALDIPTPQGTPIVAVADGIVLHGTQPTGIGYNYIAIAHENGLVTVYGHVFATLVSEGDFVEVGQIIGLSGGIPGTTGAGYRTTGAHVHFEVHYQGQRVDPLLYLPLEEIDREFIPAQYLDLYEQAVALYGINIEENDKVSQPSLEEAMSESPQMVIEVK